MKNLYKLAMSVLENKGIPMTAEEIFEELEYLTEKKEYKDLDVDKLDIAMQRHSKPTILSLQSYVPKEKYFEIIEGDPLTYGLLDENDDENDMYHEDDNIYENFEEDDEDDYLEVGDLCIYDESDNDHIRFEISSDIDDVSATLTFKQAKKVYKYLAEILEDEDII